MIPKMSRLQLKKNKKSSYTKKQEYFKLNKKGQSINANTEMKRMLE